MGLSLFAMGNSLGDLITNVSIARMGFSKMALGACIGTPLLSKYLLSLLFIYYYFYLFIYLFIYLFS